LLKRAWGGVILPDSEGAPPYLHRAFEQRDAEGCDRPGPRDMRLCHQPLVLVRRQDSATGSMIHGKLLAALNREDWAPARISETNC